jgi:hypothetical protein
MKSNRDQQQLLKCHPTISFGFYLEKAYAAAAAAAVILPSEAGATQTTIPASMLSRLTRVVDQHITSTDNAEMSSFLGDMRGALEN